MGIANYIAMGFALVPTDSHIVTVEMNPMHAVLTIMPMATLLLPWKPV